MGLDQPDRILDWSSWEDITRIKLEHIIWPDLNLFRIGYSRIGNFVFVCAFISSYCRIGSSLTWTDPIGLSSSFEFDLNLKFFDRIGSNWFGSSHLCTPTCTRKSFKLSNSLATCKNPLLWVLTIIKFTHNPQQIFRRFYHLKS